MTAVGTLSNCLVSPAAAEGTVAAAACWNHTGVYGTGSCPELKTHIHCRYCAVYASAGAQLLERQLPDDYRREWTVHYARAKHERETANVSAILFRIAREWLALPTHLFQEVAERRPIHSLPHRRKGLVLGLANVRGELLICVSLGHLLGLEQLPPREALQTHYARLLVVNWEMQRLAFPVDEVHGPHRFKPEELKGPPATVAHANPAFTQNILHWRHRSVGVLEPEALFRTLNGRLS
jgi:chemotaxis-related protein WspD